MEERGWMVKDKEEDADDSGVVSSTCSWNKVGFRRSRVFWTAEATSRVVTLAVAVAVAEIVRKERKRKR